ncbi:hypothetical protein [Nitratifractor sp.]|uniref:hypothetical protein n=1 Tax=Nitratifractor sp. TaxID=2268144 RepID=UPI0025EEFE12|nr:hypothetical protein [Nitratifractor sp.]
MKVLLFTPSRVVREMVRLATEKAGAELECVTAPEQVSSDRYELVLVDDAIALDPESLRAHLIVGETVWIHGLEHPLDERYDHSIIKPFLPSDILSLLHRELPFPEEEEDENLVDFRGTESEETTRVLDREEVARIRSLLEDNNEEPDETHRRGDGGIRLDAEELIELLATLKPKKLKKLLQGAEVTLTVRFPKEEEE